MTIFKHLVKLRKDGEYRKEQGRAIVATETLIREIAPYTTLHTLLVPKKQEVLDAKQVLVVSQSQLMRISGLKTCSDWIAEVDLPPQTPLHDRKRVLVLDQLTDPGNVGTLIRTACAFGWDGVFFLKEPLMNSSGSDRVSSSPTMPGVYEAHTRASRAEHIPSIVGEEGVRDGSLGVHQRLLKGGVDPFNEKVIRASRGALFRFPYQIGTLSGMDHVKWIAGIKGEAVDSLSPPGKLMLILGSEAHGPSSTSGQAITLPMKGEMESLNVAVAGGILLYMLEDNTSKKSCDPSSPKELP